MVAGRTPARLQFGTLAYIASYPSERPLGRKAVQKLVFLLEQLAGVNLGYKYSFYTYGVFSKELSGDLELLDQMKIIDMRYSDSTRAYVIKPSDNANLYIDALDPQKISLEKIDGFLRKFRDFPAWELEIISTAVYVGLSGSIDLVAEKVNELKPKFTVPQIRAALIEAELL